MKCQPSPLPAKYDTPLNEDTQCNIARNSSLNVKIARCVNALKSLHATVPGMTHWLPNIQCLMSLYDLLIE